MLGDGLLRMKWSPIAKLLSLPERKLALYLIGSVSGSMVLPAV